MTTLALAVAIALVHVLADRLRVAAVVARPTWLSAASGVSVAFVFLLLIPEVAVRQEALAGLPFVDHIRHPAWVAVLVGLAGFYVLEHWMLTHGKGRAEATHGAFAAHIGIFALYNVVIGFMLSDPHPDVLNSAPLYAVALGLHLLVIDEALRRHHPRRYHRSGRWVLAAAVVIGALLGLVLDLHDAVPAIALAVLSGGIVLNALKEELPDERGGRVLPFLIGIGIYALLMFALAAV